MKKFIGLCIISIAFFSCNKNCIEDPKVDCDIFKTYAHNSAKVTITNGIWGTISSMEGNCMPVVAPSPSYCKHCPVNRAVRIYEYTMPNQAVPYGNSTIFFHSFSTRLIAEVNADDEGFFQVDIPAGQYSIVIVEDNKLYANNRDGQGGLNPVIYSNGKEKVDIAMTYKAVF